jgi:hypothetical protein
MPKVVETLSQVKERQTRELKARTQARCAALLGRGHPQSSGHHTTPEPVSICLCCACQRVNQSRNLRARIQTTTPQPQTIHYTRALRHKSNHHRRRRFLYSSGRQRSSPVEGLDNMHQPQLLSAYLAHGQLLILAVHFVVQGG